MMTQVGRVVYERDTHFFKHKDIKRIVNRFINRKALSDYSKDEILSMSFTWNELTEWLVKELVIAIDREIYQLLLKALMRMVGMVFYRLTEKPLPPYPITTGSQFA